MRLHLDGVVDGDVCEAAGEGDGLVQLVLRRRQEHDVLGCGQRVAVGVAQSAVGSLPEGDKLRAVFHAERDVFAFVHNIARTDLLTVEVDGNPLVFFVDDEIERLVVQLPAAGVAGDIAGVAHFIDVHTGSFLDFLGNCAGGVVGIKLLILCVGADNDADRLFRGLEHDAVAVVHREIDLVDVCFVQNVIFFAVDEDVPLGGNLGFLVGAETDCHTVAVGERLVQEIFSPVIAGRGGDADGRNVVSALVVKRDMYGLFFFAAAGQSQQQTQRRKQQCKFLLHSFLLQSPEYGPRAGGAFKCAEKPHDTQ